MYLQKNDIKDWKLWFKIIVIIILLSSLIFEYVEGIVNIDKPVKYNGEEYLPWAIYGKDGGNPIGYDYLGYTINYFSFFTKQSNIFVLIYFIVSVIKHNYQLTSDKKSFVLSRTVTLLLTIYILITGLIFNFMLLPTMIGAIELSAISWLSKVILHLFAPVAMFIYVCFLNTIKFEKCSKKEFIKYDFRYSLIYPIIYLIYCLIKGEMVYRAYGSPEAARTHYAYPYPFLEIHNPDAMAGIHGAIWLLIVTIIIIGLIIGLGIFVNLLMNKKQNNNIYK